ncbi:MAG: PaaI family thioesterase [Burkholderiales bacterium]
MPVNKRYGIADADELKAMTGLQFVQGLVDGSLPLNTMARVIGYDVVEASRGRVVVTADASEEHLNPEGTVHGGVAATLLDTCMGLAVKSMLEQGQASTTLEFKISFLRPVTKETGLLRAEGSVLSCGRRIGAAEGRLTDGSGRLLAHGTTTCMIFPRQGNS